MFCFLLKWESVKNMTVGKTVMASQFFYHNCSKLFLWWERILSEHRFCRKKSCKKLLRWESLRGLVYWKIGDLPPIFPSELCRGVSKMRIVSEHGVLKNCDVLQIFRSELFQDAFKLRILKNKRNRKKRWFSQGFLIRKIQKNLRWFFCVWKKNGICLPIFPSILFQATSRTRFFWKHGVLRNIDFLPFFPSKLFQASPKMRLL